MQKENLLVQRTILQFCYPTGKCLPLTLLIVFILDFVLQLSLLLTLNRYLSISVSLQKFFNLIVNFNELLPSIDLSSWSVWNFGCFYCSISYKKDPYKLTHVWPQKGFHFNPFRHNVVKWPSIMHERVNALIKHFWVTFETFTNMLK